LDLDEIRFQSLTAVGVAVIPHTLSSKSCQTNGKFRQPSHSRLEQLSVQRTYIHN